MRMLDTLMNLVTGLGTAKDKHVALRHVFTGLDRVEIDAAYRGDWVAKKIIDIPPHDEVRNGRDWQAENDQIEKIEAEEKRLQLWPKVLRARRLARLYGGAAIYIGVADGDPRLPLRPDAIGKDGVLYLHVLSRYDLSILNDIDRDVTSEHYGEPEFWQVRGNGGANAIIHPSRLIRFVGAALPDLETAPEPYWGDSVLEAAMDAVRNLGLSQQGVAQMLNEAKIDVIKVPHLMASLSDPEYEGRLRQRLQLANMMKSSVNALVIDSEEEWDQKQISFATLPDVMDRYMQAAAGAADIPATRMLGQSPQGMSATGESDYRNYLDRIAAGQELELRPTLEPLDECIIRSALGSRPADIHYTWAPLWQASEKDAADIALKKAQAFKVDVDSGLMPDSALSKARINQLIEDGTYPGLEAAMDEAEAEGDAIDFGERAEQPEVETTPQGAQNARPDTNRGLNSGS